MQPQLWLGLAVVACSAPAAPPPLSAAVRPTLADARAAERGPARDFARAAEIYASLCNDGRGALDACFALADAIVEAKGVAFDLVRLQKLYGALCGRGDAVACVTKLWIEATGPRGMPGKRPEAEIAADFDAQHGRVEQACEHDDGRACEWLAQMRGGDGSTAEWDRREKYGVACKHGRIEACSHVAYELVMCGEPEVDDAAGCEKRQLAEWRTHDFDADRVEAVTKLVDECRGGDARACSLVPSQRIPLATLCAAHDYGACSELGCVGDDAAEALARTHGLDHPNCYVAGKDALLEWRRTPPGPHRARFEPIEAERRGPIGGRATKPFEAVRFEHHGGRDRHDWPRFDVYNLNDRAITELSVCLYAYSFTTPADPPKQVARIAATLPGFTLAANTIVPLHVDLPTDLPAGTGDVLIDYDHVRFEGDASASDDTTRCPAQRAYDRDRAPTRW